MKKIILTIVLGLSFATNLYSQKVYDDLYINNEELQSLKNEIDAVRSAIVYNNSIYEPNNKLRKTLSKIINRYRSYLWEGGANQAFFNAALHRGPYLDEVLEMYENARKVLHKLHDTNTYLGNLFVRDVDKAWHYNMAKDYFNEAILYYKDVNRNLKNVKDYYISSILKKNEYKTEEPQNGKGFSGDKEFITATFFYQGEFKDGKKHGYGVYKQIFNSNRKFEYDMYVGFYENGEEHGQGTYIWVSGTKFVGEWREGEMYNGTAYDNRGARICDYRNGIRQ